MYYIYVPGLQYAGETNEDAERRERAMKEHNLKMDQLLTDEKRQREEPMESMKDWLRKYVEKLP